MTQFILIAAATLVSEDLTCITTGGLIAAGQIGFAPGVLACVFGIFAGDLFLYFAGRLIGRPVLQWKPLRRLLTEEKLDGASAWLARRGASVVMLSRFTPGLRLPTYVAAGLLRTRFWTFSGYFLLAALLWTPVLVGSAAVLGKSLPHVWLVGPLLFIAGSLWRRHSCLPRRDSSRRVWGFSKFNAWRQSSLLQRVVAATTPVRDSHEAQKRPDESGRGTQECVRHATRRLLGWWRRKTRWEFWPPYLSYLPVAPYILYLGIRHRCLTLFTLANPGIPSGGFVGESKSAILSNLSHVPDFLLLAEALPPGARFRIVKERFSYPVVLKPDAGERGSGVAIVRDDQALIVYLESAAIATIAQKYVAGLEFGIFYYRIPGEATGRILSITEKRFPAVVGDGLRTITELVLADDRAVCLADLYLACLKRPADDVPAAGEIVPLAEVGAHSRGTVFLNGAHLETKALRDAVDAVAKTHPGFYFGRFDVRSASIEDLQAGRFHVLELNGVTAEATHIYDTAVSVWEAYRVLFRQWKIAFEIGAKNRALGYSPMRLRDFMSLLRHRRAFRPNASPRPDGSLGRELPVG